MKPANKLKLKTLLAELHEDGEDTEGIVEVITDELNSSEQIDLIEDILTGVKDEDQVNDFIERSARDLIAHSKLYAESILEEYKDSDLLKAVSDEDEIEKFIKDKLRSDDGMCESVLYSIGGNIQINPKLFTLDKMSRLEEFMNTLFPYHNEQTQIQLNF